MAKGVVGQIVEVGEPTAEDFWRRPFVGTIKGVQGTSYIIEDQEGHVNEVDQLQIRWWY